MTSIHLPGLKDDSGIAEWGRKTHAEMVATYRARAARLRAESDRILAAADEDFIVETYLGQNVQRNTMRVYPEEEINSK